MEIVLRVAQSDSAAMEKATNTSIDAQYVEGIRYCMPTIVIVALLMIAGPALTGSPALKAQTCPPSVCPGPPPPRGPFGVLAEVDGTTVTLSWELPPGTNVFLEVFVRQ